MALNVYLESCGSAGYQGAIGSGVAGQLEIPGLPGKRLVILSYAVTAGQGPTVTTTEFRRSLDDTTLKSAAASGATTIVLTDQPVNRYSASDTMASHDYIVVVLDDGTYQFLYVSPTSATSNWSLSSALTDTAAAGNKVYFMGGAAAGDVGTHRIPTMTSAAQSANPAFTPELGFVMGTTKGSPIILYCSGAGCGNASIDYCTYGYINK